MGVEVGVYQMQAFMQCYCLFVLTMRECGVLNMLAVPSA